MVIIYGFFGCAWILNEDGVIDGRISTGVLVSSRILLNGVLRNYFIIKIKYTPKPPKIKILNFLTFSEF